MIASSIIQALASTCLGQWEESLTGAFLSMGLITNFLSLKEMFLISLHGKPILGVSLWKWRPRTSEQAQNKKDIEGWCLALHPHQVFLSGGRFIASSACVITCYQASLPALRRHKGPPDTTTNTLLFVPISHICFIVSLCVAWM